METPALAPPTPPTNAKRQEAERRVAVRHVSGQEAVSRPLDLQDTLSWGAQVRDVSLGGIALIVCYPFKPGTYLAIEIQGVPTAARPLLARVIHAEDQADGTWAVGCEFVKPLTPSDVKPLL